MPTATAQVRAHLVENIATIQEYIARKDITSEGYKNQLVGALALLAAFDRENPDVDAILAMDKDAVRAVPESTFHVVQEALWGSDVAYEKRLVFAKEVSRRKAAATKAARAAEQAAREASGEAFTAGQAVEVHAFGHWYRGEVVRITKTGSVVVKYTSGTGVTREKTVGSDLVRKG